jgi:hypothetical protein
MSGRTQKDARKKNPEKQSRTDQFNAVKPTDIPRPKEFKTRTLNSKVRSQ